MPRSPTGIADSEMMANPKGAKSMMVVKRPTAAFKKFVWLMLELSYAIVSC